MSVTSKPSSDPPTTRGATSASSSGPAGWFVGAAEDAGLEDPEGPASFPACVLHPELAEAQLTPRRRPMKALLVRRAKRWLGLIMFVPTAARSRGCRSWRSRRRFLIRRFFRRFGEFERARRLVFRRRPRLGFVVRGWSRRTTTSSNEQGRRENDGDWRDEPHIFVPFCFFVGGGTGCGSSSSGGTPNGLGGMTGSGPVFAGGGTGLIFS